MKPVTFTRQELYKLVWEKPLTHIAKELGYSDNGIRKVCIKHNIPLPKAGYWSKLKYNKKVKKTPLPKSDNETKDINFNTDIEKKKGGLHTETSLLKQSIEETIDLTLTAPEKLSKPDPHIQKTKEYFKELKVRKQKNDWQFVHNTTGIVSINVSDPLLSRALRFMDTLIKLFKKRGHQIIVDDDTKIVINGEEYKIRLTEKHKRIKNTSSSYPEFELIPTGFLCLKFDNLYDREWTDTVTKPIENKLSDILSWFEIKAEKDRIKRIERAIQHKIWEEERKKEEELKQLQDEEFSKFQSMFDTATRLHKSQYLRNYIKEFEAYSIKTKSLDKEKQEWIKWATEKADWYDPFIEKEVPLLANIDRTTLQPKKRKYW
jgi:hypothetical protein